VEIILVRHGQPAWENDGGAVDDPPLTALGQQQAQLAAAALEDEGPFDALYVSPLLRARQTAAPIGQAVGLELREQSWLRELGLPLLGGQTNEQVQRFFAYARARDLDSQFHGLPGGESFRHFHERVTGGFESLLCDGHRLQIHEEAGHRLWQVPNDRRRLIFVAHEGTNSMLLSHLLGLVPLPWSWMHFSSAWAGLSKLHLTPVANAAVWSLEYFNSTHHLRVGDADTHGRSASLWDED
jgi:probable phosphoglycerate mutase